MDKLILIFVIFCFSYPKKSQKELNKKRKIIDSLLKTGEPCNIIRANFVISKTRDSLYIDTLFNDITNPQICHQLKFKGITVYQSKVIALKKIANIDSQININYETDTLIINYLKKVFKK